MQKILNLTQHAATPAQVAAGVEDPLPSDHGVIRGLLDFPELPSASTIASVARMLAQVAAGDSRRCYGIAPQQYTTAMIGGAPYLMAELEAALRYLGIEPVYAFSVRKSVEALQADGTVRKTAVFDHVGFVTGRR